MNRNLLNRFEAAQNAMLKATMPNSQVDDYGNLPAVAIDGLTGPERRQQQRDKLEALRRTNSTRFTSW